MMTKPATAGPTTAPVFAADPDALLAGALVNVVELVVAAGVLVVVVFAVITGTVLVGPVSGGILDVITTGGMQMPLLHTDV